MTAMQTITEQDVLRLLPMTEAIRLVRESFAALATGAAQNQPRRRLVLPTGAVLHQLAGAFGGYFGAKIYSTHVKHGAWFTVLLYEAATGKPLASIEANHLGQIRTGAATGVATDLLARPDARVLGVIGTGFQARTQIEAVRAVRDIAEVRVWSRNADRRAAFAADMQARATETAEEAIRGADIVVTATFAKDPVLDAAWVAPGAHINAAGSNNAQRREIPAELVERAALIAVDSLEQAKIESGDLLLAWQDTPERWHTDPRLFELSETAAGRRGRTSDAEVTVFKSNGLGVQDIAVGGYVFERYS
ncbi:MAG: ornithine cyclodeaminase family protein [Bryobacterales bacterium]|nr:ornithine cyclodeaminase family protein [Bryobacterales bacterium]